MSSGQASRSNTHARLFHMKKNQSSRTHLHFQHRRPAPLPQRRTVSFPSRIKPQQRYGGESHRAGSVFFRVSAALTRGRLRRSCSVSSHQLGVQLGLALASKMQTIMQQCELHFRFALKNPLNVIRREHISPLTTRPSCAGLDSHCLRNVAGDR